MPSLLFYPSSVIIYLEQKKIKFGDVQFSAIVLAFPSVCYTTHDDRIGQKKPELDFISSQKEVDETGKLQKSSTLRYFLFCF